ncbi:MAG: efflux RND transporter periplasmic adaptor subunit [Sphaerochaeta sp.]
MSETNKKHKKTGIVLILLIIALAGAIVYSIFFKEATPLMVRPEQSTGTSNYAVNVEQVDETTMTNYLKLNGDVIASQSVSIYPDIAGVLTSLDVSLGDYVKVGQVIGSVDPSQPGQNYSVNPVKSTIDGTITDIAFDVGDTISSTTVPLATVGDLQNLELDSFVSEKYMSSIQLGQKAEITFISYDDVVFTGTVVEISPVLDNSSRTLEIKIALDENIDNIVKSGMFGTIKLVTETKTDVISIPSTSLSTNSEGTYVYVVSDDNTAVLTYVETGLEIDSRVEILSGLNVGDKIITRGQSMIQDGSAVTITEE